MSEFKRMRQILRNASGFSLIEVMVAASVMIVIALAIAQQSKMQAQMITGTESKMDIYDFRTSIAIALTKNNACQATLNGKKAGDAVTKIVRMYQDFSTSGSPWIQEDLYDLSTQSRFYLGYLELTGMRLVGGLPAGNTGEMKLEVEIQNKKDVTGPKHFRRDIVMQATLDGAGAITDCQAFVENAMAKSILCANPPVQCIPAANFCAGELFPNLASDCLCLGTKTSGTSVNGLTCTDPGSTPTPTPTSPI